MNDDSQLMFKIADLTLASLNGTLNESDFQQFEELLQNDPLAVEYFQTILWTHIGLNSMEGISSLQEINGGRFDHELWQALSNEEKTAPEVEISAVLKEPKVDETPTGIKRVHPKVSKFSIFSLALSSAALQKWKTY